MTLSVYRTLPIPRTKCPSCLTRPRLSPPSGSWRVSINSDSYRILIFCRRYTVYLLGCRPAQEVVGTKRRRDIEDLAYDAGETQMIKYIGLVTELSSGEKLLLDVTTKQLRARSPKKSSRHPSIQGFPSPPLGFPWPNRDRQSHEARHRS